MGTPTVSQAKTWTPDGMLDQAKQSHEHGQAVVTHVKQVKAAADSTADHYQGKAAEAARAQADRIYQQGMQTANGLFAAGDAQAAGAASVQGEQAAALAAIGSAEGEQFMVAEDGTVTPNPAKVALAMAVLGPQGAAAVAALQARAKQLTAAIQAALHGMGQADDQAATAIEAAYRQLPAGTGPGKVDSHGDYQKPPPPKKQAIPKPPPKNASVDDNKKWWDSLSEEQKKEEIQTHPADVGNRDGIPADARDQANRNRIPIERARLEHERDVLQEQTSGVDGWFRKEFGNDDAKLYYTEQKLKDLDKLEQLSKNTPGFKLMYMDMTGERGMAAYAIGDPDTADHIAVTTPGKDTTINGSFDEMVKESNLLKRTAHNELSLHGRGNESASSGADGSTRRPTARRKKAPRNWRRSTTASRSRRPGRAGTPTSPHWATPTAR